MVEKQPSKRKAYRPRSTLEIGLWFTEKMLAAFGTKGHTDIAERISNAAKPGFVYDRKEIEHLRDGSNKTPLTPELINAICKAFTITNPLYVASTEEEALEFQAARHKYEQKQRDALQELVENAVVATDSMHLRMSALTEDEVVELAEIKTKNDEKARKKAERSLRAKKARKLARDRA